MQKSYKYKKSMIGLVNKIGRKWSNLTTVSHLFCIFSSLTMLIVSFLFDLIRFSKEYIIFFFEYESKYFKLFVWINDYNFKLHAEDMKNKLQRRIQ